MKGEDGATSPSHPRVTHILTLVVWQNNPLTAEPWGGDYGGGREEGNTVSHPTSATRRPGTRRGAPEVNPGNKSFPTELDSTIDLLDDLALDVSATRHSDEAYTLIILHLSGRYRVWLASLSLDQRWTLSPRDDAKVLEIPDLP